MTLALGDGESVAVIETGASILLGSLMANNSHYITNTKNLRF